MLSNNIRTSLTVSAGKVVYDRGITDVELLRDPEHMISLSVEETDRIDARDAFPIEAHCASDRAACPHILPSGNALLIYYFLHIDSYTAS
jgi:hypothetical protein